MQGVVFNLGTKGNHSVFEVNEKIFLQKYKNYPIVLLSIVELYRKLPSLLNRNSQPDLESYDIYDFLQKLDSFLKGLNWNGNCLLIEVEKVNGQFFAIEINKTTLIILKQDWEFTFARNDLIVDKLYNFSRPVIKKQKIIGEQITDCFKQIEYLYRQTGFDVLNLI